MKHTLAPAATVVAVALLLQGGAAVNATRFAPAPSSSGSKQQATGLYATGPGLSIPGLADALTTEEPSPRSTLAPSPSGLFRPAATAQADPGSSERPDGDGGDFDEGGGSGEAESPPVAVATPARGAIISAFVRVSSQRVAPGDDLRYRYIARNTGNKTFRGDLTVTTHTPAGTFRCSSDLGGNCVVPGDYSDGSKEPNETHVNPEAHTASVRIRPGEKAVLYILRVQVSQTAAPDLVLHNHAHIQSGPDGNGPKTIDAPAVRVSE